MNVHSWMELGMGVHRPQFTRKAWLGAGIAVLAILLVGGIALAASGGGGSTPAAAATPSAGPGHNNGKGNDKDDDSCDRDEHGAVGATAKPSRSRHASDDRVAVHATPSVSPKPSMSRDSHNDGAGDPDNDDYWPASASLSCPAGVTFGCGRSTVNQAALDQSLRGPPFDRNRIDGVLQGMPDDSQRPRSPIR